MRATVYLQNLDGDTSGKIIERTLSDVDNISEVGIDLERKTVAFNFHSVHDFERAARVLEMIGHPVYKKKHAYGR